MYVRIAMLLYSCGEKSVQNSDPYRKCQFTYIHIQPYIQQKSFPKVSEIKLHCMLNACTAAK